MKRTPRYLTLAVFTAGMTTMAVEMCASRLLGNVFGTSNLVWANIIGLILVYLAAGYFIGGRWADRDPRPVTFYRLLAWAALVTAVVPVIARPVLQAAASAVEGINAAVALGSFAAVLVLFVVPVTLLGCVSPFAIRLALQEVDSAGNVAGRLYAVSTFGSILGTFLPVLWLIPAIGTTRTFLLFSGILLGVALFGLARVERRAAVIALWMPVALIGLTLLGASGPVKQTRGQLMEKESAYNYIQVVERDGMRLLLLNEGQGVHSVYRPGELATYGTWDYFLAAPFFNAVPYPAMNVDSLAIVGLAAGTTARQFTAVYGPIAIDGFEIDPAIIDVGRTYFDMNEPNLRALAVDGRWGLAHSGKSYRVIAVDAYRPPYIPWHLTTREFFELVRSKLSPDGVLVINVARMPADRRLVEAMTATLAAVFPSVYVVDVPDSLNSILYATVLPTQAENLARNLAGLQIADPPVHPFLLDVLTRTLENLRPAVLGGVVFTDDRAPVEQLTNAMVVRFVLGGGLDSIEPQ
ncbi:MAG TPA: fused MFS/spermidine synthase [Anaerolineales bacterium]|nr:fused MFS/spermidine synthase [Anaerolineales bacterium]